MTPVGPSSAGEAEAPSPFDAPYDGLAQLPRSLWLPGLIASAGTVEQRLEDSAHWLECLNAGELPPSSADFGDAQACGPLRQVVGELNLPRLAKGLGAMGEQIVRTLLWHLDRLVDHQPRLSRAQAIEQVTVEFRAAWQQDSAGFEEELALLRQLGEAGEMTWDQLQGQLRRREWATARRAAERLAQMPDLVALIQRLGRQQRVAGLPRALEPVRHAHQDPTPWRAVETSLPDAPGELTGIRLSDRIEGMLASEAVLLNHPLARRWWQARWAEGRLLTHDTQAVLVDWRPDPSAGHADAVREDSPQPLGHGPIIVCLDTSGSMHGAPEHIAKAVVIAAVQSARASRRACKLIAFGGPGELLERDLVEAESQERMSRTKGTKAASEIHAIPALLELMGQAFDGGTDIQTPIERAIERVHEGAWRSADMLLVTDGEFGCLRETLISLDEARAELGLRVQGVLVGDRETMGLMEVCDDIHWVRDWRRHAHDTDAGGGPRSASTQTAGFSPVHSKSLTALFFPNALSARAARHRMQR